MKRSEPKSTYAVFAQAMAERKQIVCRYDGYARELCPVVLGHTDREEVALVYQFAGASKSRLPPGGQWKCLRLSKVTDVELRDGPWRAGSSHRQAQTCVESVDLDVNPASPYAPRRRIGPVNRSARRSRC
jgi:hypothetical protein